MESFCACFCHEELDRPPWLPDALVAKTVYSEPQIHFNAFRPEFDIDHPVCHLWQFHRN